MSEGADKKPGTPAKRPLAVVPAGQPKTSAAPVVAPALPRQAAPKDVAPAPAAAAPAVPAAATPTKPRGRAPSASKAPLAPAPVAKAAPAKAVAAKAPSSRPAVAKKPVVAPPAAPVLPAASAAPSVPAAPTLFTAPASPVPAPTAPASTAPAAGAPILPERAEPATPLPVEPAKITSSIKDITMDMNANFSGFQDAIGEAQAKAKAAFEKSSSLLGEAGEFAKGNVEAFIESGKIFADGVQDIGSTFVAEGRTAFENLTGDFKELAAAKSPTDFLKVQSDIARKNFDSAVAYGSKNSETLLKLFSDAVAPLSGRVSLAVEKARQSVPTSTAI